jgi:hypothetical protein
MHRFGIRPSSWMDNKIHNLYYRFYPKNLDWVWWLNVPGGREFWIAMGFARGVMEIDELEMNQRLTNEPGKSSYSDPPVM